MQRRRGFTIIEVLITLVIMAGLLTLGVMAFGNTQLKARDEKRLADVTAIARGLEQRYDKGNSYATAPNTAPSGEGQAGSYPSIAEIQHINGDSGSGVGWSAGEITGGYRLKLFTGTQDSNYVSPTGKPFINWCTTSCAKPTDSTTITEDSYQYAPVNPSGDICLTAGTTGCMGYYLYWKSEADGTTKVVKSKRQ
jgi:prepilin-type N-terminal cleavage/methylation domain-containing protein